MKPRATTYRVLLDAETTGHAFAELTDIGGGETPCEVVGWRDRRGRLCRARADYPNGWRVEVFFTRPKHGLVEISSWRATQRFLVRKVPQQ